MKMAVKTKIMVAIILTCLVLMSQNLPLPPPPDTDSDRQILSPAEGAARLLLEELPRGKVLGRLELRDAFVFRV